MGYTQSRIWSFGGLLPSHPTESLSTLQEKAIFLTQKARLMPHLRGKLCSFIQCKVQYVVFIVAYITLKLQLDIKL
jgi:hypothetical protein